MLHRVAEYVDKNAVAYRPGYKCKFARFAIHCDSEGKLLGVDSLVTENAKKGRTFTSAPDFTFSEIKGGKERKSHFLIDSADTVALLGESKDQRVQQKHEYFWQMIQAAGEAVPQLNPLRHLPEAMGAIRRELKDAGAKPSDLVTFRIDSTFPLKSNTWHDWWDEWRLHTVEAQNKDKRVTHNPGTVQPGMVSYLSGKLVKPADTHPKLNVLPGGVTAGAPLIGFNEPAFLSFGLQQSQNAAMSELDAVKYAAGLNDLIQKHSRCIAGTQVVYWYKDGVAGEEDPIGLADLPASEADTVVPLRRMRELLDAIRSGKRPDLEGNEYYILVLSGTGGRAMVRSWEEGSYAHLAYNVERWLTDLQITTVFGALPSSSPRIQQVIECILPPKKSSQQREDWLKSATTIRAALWSAAIDGLPVPFSAATRVIEQLRSFVLTGGFDKLFDRNDRHSDSQTPWLLWTRMALLKAYHLRNGSAVSGEIAEMKPQLNPDHPSPAYQCGRLMAVLADVQRAALGNEVGANVIQRYYAAASTTPALVIGRMVKNSQFHLGKIESNRPDMASRFTQRLAEIHCKIGDNAPSTLTLEEQTLFALGFYQQIAERYNGKNKDNNEQEEAAQ
jgi:CRISPR-associated protein Csd1